MPPVQILGDVSPLSHRDRRPWTDDITEWTGMKINEAAAAAEDRDRWRGILRAANPSYGGRH